MNPGEVFRATAKKDAKFIEWNVVEGLFTELEKIKMMVLPDGEKVTAEITNNVKSCMFFSCVPKWWGV